MSDIMEASPEEILEAQQFLVKAVKALERQLQARTVEFADDVRKGAFQSPDALRHRLSRVADKILLDNGLIAVARKFAIPLDEFAALSSAARDCLIKDLEARIAGALNVADLADAFS